MLTPTDPIRIVAGFHSTNGGYGDGGSSDQRTCGSGLETWQSSGAACPQGRRQSGRNVGETGQTHREPEPLIKKFRTTVEARSLRVCRDRRLRVLRASAAARTVARTGRPASPPSQIRSTVWLGRTLHGKERWARR